MDIEAVTNIDLIEIEEIPHYYNSYADFKRKLSLALFSSYSEVKNKRFR